jgi:hypothetical protein
MTTSTAETRASDTASRRPYVTPRLTVYGAAAVLTRDPQQSRPRELSGTEDVRILFLGDNA